MKVAFIIGEFPSFSKTFILNQITELIDQGHRVDILFEVRHHISSINNILLSLCSHKSFRIAIAEG
jgi:hypothetical protein